MSPKLRSHLSAASLALILCWALFAQTSTRAQSGPRTISVDEIQPGMTGYGLTVFRGTEPERFDVEVIDVLHNFRAGQDLILARTPHPLLNRARAVGGMSGSPIYLDGRLAGAYAYGWPFNSEPVIGITPIVHMLHELTRPVRPDSFPGAQPLQPLRARSATRQQRAASYRVRDPYLGGPVDALEGIRALGQRTRAQAPRGAHVASTPLLLGGFTPSAADFFSEELEAFGLVGLQAGGSGTREGAAPTRYVDGGAIGVQLVRGDISATGIGTVTHVGNNHRVIAFGHPMMNMGQSGLPTTTARVLHIFTSQQRSFKIAEGISPLGTLIHDRQSAIVIDTALQPATIPVVLRLHGVDDAPQTTWNFEVASHRQLTPALIFSAIRNAISAASSDTDEVMFRANYALSLEGRDPVRLEDQGWLPGGPSDARLSSLRLFRLLAIAFENPFEPALPTALEIDLHLSFGNETLEILDASISSDQVDPGSDVIVRVRLRRHEQAQDEFEQVRVHIPEHAAGETLKLEIAAGDRVTDERPTPTSIEDLFRGVIERYQSTSLVTSLRMPSRGLRFRGHVTSSLPRSALSSLARVSAEGQRPFVTYLRHATATTSVIEGSASLDLHVRDARRH